MFSFTRLIFLIALVLLVACQQSPDSVVSRQATPKDELPAANEAADSSNEQEVVESSSELSDAKVNAGEGPWFCRLALGGNRERTIVAAYQDDQLFVDLNGNGDWNEDGEKFIGKLESEFEGTKFVNFQIGDVNFKNDFGKPLVFTQLKYRLAIKPESVRVAINIWQDGILEFTNNAHLMPARMTREIETSPTVCIGGSTSMGLYTDPQSIPMGEEFQFYALVGFAGEGRGSFAAMAHVDIPSDVHPQAQFEFTNRDPSRPPLFVTAHLRERC